MSTSRVMFTLTDKEVGQALMEWVQRRYPSSLGAGDFIAVVELQGCTVRTQWSNRSVCGQVNDSLVCTLAPEHVEDHVFVDAKAKVRRP